MRRWSSEDVWASGEPQLIENRLVAEGGFFPKPGVRIFNFYKPPQIIAANSSDIRSGATICHALWPDEASHIECCIAHRVRCPGEKITHAVVLGGEQGVGKDAIIEPLKRAVGAWNFHEISPQEGVWRRSMSSEQSVVLRISEGKDLGDIDRFAFYDGVEDADRSAARYAPV